MNRVHNQILLAGGIFALMSGGLSTVVYAVMPPATDLDQESMVSSALPHAYESEASSSRLNERLEDDEQRLEAVLRDLQEIKKEMRNSAGAGGKLSPPTQVGTE